MVEPHDAGAALHTEPSAEDLRDILDDALLLVARSERDDATRRELADAVSGALQAVYAALGMSNDAAAYRDAMVVASMQIEDAIAIDTNAAPDPTISGSLVRARTIAARPPIPRDRWRLPSTAAKRGRLPASIGSPITLDLSREVVPPVVPVSKQAVQPAVEPSPLVKPQPVGTLDDLDALLAEAEALPVAPEIDRDAPNPTSAPIRGVHDSIEALVERARPLAEELGCLGAQRRPTGGQGWRGKARVEERLLARLDAIVSCGTHVLPELVRGLESRPVPDPELTWALVLLFGVIAGDDSLDEALRLVRAAELSHPGLRAAAIDALSLVPTARVDGRLRPWLRHSEEARRVIAVSVLGRRGTLMADELTVASCDVEVSVVRAAAEAAAGVPGALDAEALDRLIHHRNQEVARAALQGGAWQGHSIAVSRARALVRAHRGEYAGANLIYALCAGRAALDALLEDAAVGGSPSSLAALGWFGHLSAIPFLIGRLESDDNAVVIAAALGLQRITGMSAPASQAMTFRLPTEAPIEAADPWRRWWQSASERLDPQTRYRLGAPFAPESNLSEMRAPASSDGVRRLCALELRARLGTRSPFDTRTFVAKQLSDLTALEEELRTSERARLGWPVTMHI